MRRLELELVIDSFAGGGGASLGIEQAIGRPVDIAINHSADAIAMHRMNHPETTHYQEDVWAVDPVKVCAGRPVALMWLSPDCTHFSKAAGNRPKSKDIRGLAWVALRWAGTVRPRIIMLENVEEFRTWGPVPKRKASKWKHRALRGTTFARFNAQLRALGYEVEWRELRAMDYGAPTSRKRLFMVARCDGERIRWPQPTHGKHPGALPYRTAAECIDFTLPCPSIFLSRAEGRKLGVNRPLVAATMRRIAAGLKRFVLESPNPFIVNLTHGGRLESLGEPFTTITGANRGEKALVAPYLAGVGGRAGQSPERTVDAPYHTTTSKADTVLVSPYLAGVTHSKSGGNIDDVSAPLRTTTTSKGGEQALVAPYLVRQTENGLGYPATEPLGTVVASGVTQSLIAPTLIQQGWGEREGQAPRALDIEQPLGTIVAQGNKHAVAEAELMRADFLAKHFGGHETPGSELGAPIDTVTARDHHALVSSHLAKLYGTSAGSPNDEPVPTVTSGGQHLGEVRAFLTSYYSTQQWPDIKDPLPTVTARDRLGLVYVGGLPYAIVDIGMRMLTPRELFTAQGFPAGYIIDRGYHGRKLTKSKQIDACGNSVPPAFSAALVRANVVGDLGQVHLFRGYEDALVRPRELAEAV